MLAIDLLGAAARAAGDARGRGLHVAMDADGAVEQALANPSLIKRPILRTEKHLRAGFNADEWKALIQ